MPSDAEWKLLTAFLGGADAAGSKMKAKHTDRDQTSNGSNTSGFEGFPAGWYDYLNGTSISLNSWWGWWSSTEENSKKTRKANKADDAWSCWMISFAGNAKITLFEKVNGMSVRCIMD